MTIKPGRQPSIPARKWETMQPVLYDLYIQQDLTLRATQRVMNERHGFTASIQCYKRKFTQWNWNKNISITKARAAYQRIQELGREGKPTICRIGGRDYSSDDIESTLRRSREYKSRRAAPSPTRSFIVSIDCRTPPPSDGSIDSLFTTPASIETPASIATPATLETSAMDCDEASEDGNADQQLIRHAAWPFQNPNCNADQSSTRLPWQEADTAMMMEAVQSGYWLATTTTVQGQSPAQQRRSITYNNCQWQYRTNLTQIQSSLIAPDDHFYSEKMLWTVRTFVIQNFESKQWYSDDPRYDCRSQGFGLVSRGYSNRMRAALLDSYLSTNCNHAIAYMNRACSHVMSALRENDSVLLRDLLWLLRKYRRLAPWDLTDIFLRHLQDCARQLHQNDQHPLVSWAGLMHDHGSDQNVLDALFLVLRDAFNQELSPHHYSSLGIRYDTLAYVPTADVIASWQSLHSDVENYIGGRSSLYQRCRAKLARLLYEAGAYTDVLNLFPHLISPLPSSPTSSTDELWTAEFVASSLFALSQRTEAISVLRRGLQSAKTSGLRKTRKISQVKDFLGVLLQHGEVEEAWDFRRALTEFREDQMRELEGEMEKMRLGIIE